ncbi:MAG TPA: ATP-binding cassette domain-containing protein [Stellaceae bacterium]|nr:ATP-binding cassette domain-containing protein [Stellaceae bacterium]
MTRLRVSLAGFLTRGINAPLLAGAGLLAAYPVAFNAAYDLRLMSVAGIYALIVIGYQFIFGHAGALSLAQGTFFGLGAYVTGVGGSQLGWGFAATFPLSLALPVLLAALVGAPVLRLGSHYFALATLGIGQVMLLVAVNWQDVTGGANGLPGVPGIVLFGAALPRGLPLLASVWGLVALAALIAWQATRGAWGRALAVLRASPLEAAAIGIDGGALRFAAFLLSALYAGAAGALYAHTIRVISPEVLEFPIMVSCLTMAVVGGSLRIAGAILGAVLLIHLPEWLRFLDGFYLIAYGLVLLAVIVLVPSGAIGAAERLRAALFPARPGPSPPPIALPPRATVAAVDPVLAVSDLAKSFGGVVALAGVDLVVAPGEILGLIGPNGSGKTTLINPIAGTHRADTGMVRLGGEAIGALPSYAIARRGIGRSFQSGHLAAGMSALDAVATARLAASGAVSLRRAFGDLGGAALRQARGEAMHCLAAMGAGASALQPCEALPAGARRRVEIARALALQPALLLLDEPAAGLAADEQADLARRLAALARGGLALLVVEHNMAFLMPLADRIVCLERGRIIAVGSPAEIRADPRVVATYLGTAALPVPPA